ncbi:MAG: hypothetical protein ABI867_06940 [Kofleriaceae bacterium]
MAARGFAPEPSPWNKPIASVHIFNEDVFAEKNRFLQFFNHFHVTTREYAIRQELVIGVGEYWDQARVEETARRLRDPLWSSVVVVVPVISGTPGAVDMLVVTRDIWSLRLNTQYTIQQGTLTNLSFSFSENNFLGTRSLVALGMTMDQGSIRTGPIFLDKNLMGSKAELSARFDVIFNREDLLGIAECPVFSSSDEVGCHSAGNPANGRKLTYEGTQSSISLSRPLFSLASKWGVGTSFSHRYAIDRRFRGLGLFPVDCSTGECVLPRDDNGRVPSVLEASQLTADATLLGVQYEMRRWAVDASAVRQWGKRWKHQLSFGHSVASQKPKPLDTFPGNALEREAFIRDILPRTELTSTPFVSYGFFQPTFKTLRNVDTFELAEDARLGLTAEVSAAVGLEALGSDANFQRASWSASYGLPWGRDGLVRPSLGMSIRYQDIDKDGDHEFIDNSFSTSVRVITPTYKWARLVSLTTLATRWNDAANGFFSIGSDSGLRGFLINEFSGQRLLRSQLELRSIPVPFWVVRLGAVLFYDAGGATDTFKEFQLHQDAGLGFRMLIPQTARELFRFDFAIPLDGNAAGKVRFIAGFESAF